MALLVSQFVYHVPVTLLRALAQHSSALLGTQAQYTPRVYCRLAYQTDSQ